MIKALVIDFGGVLFPIQPYIGEKPKKEKFDKIKQLVIDIYVEKESQVESKSYTPTQFVEDLAVKGGKEFTSEELKAIEKSILDINSKFLDYMKNVVEIMDIYAIVNEAPKWTELRCYFHDLNPYFKKVYISSDIGLEKPDPEIFKFFTDDSEMLPTECLIIDDSEENVDAAKSLGFEGVVYKHE